MYAHEYKCANIKHRSKKLNEVFSMEITLIN